MTAVLVTGGAGFIGSHAVLALQDAGIRCAVVDDMSNGSERLLQKGVPFLRASVGDAPAVREFINAHGITAVMHFAGSVVVPESVSNPGLYYRNNTGNTLTLAETALRAGVTQFIFSSTAAVYGEPESSPILETAALKPINPYGSSKLMSEVMLRDLSAAFPEFRVVALRYFNVAGADPQGRAGQAGKNATHLIKVTMETAVGRRPSMDVFGTDYPTPDGTCVRDYIHVSDLAEAHVAALRYLERGGATDVFNCGYGQGFSVREVLTAAADVVGKQIPHRMAPRRPGDPAALVSSADKLRRAMRWTPKYNELPVILRSAFAWERTL